MTLWKCDVCGKTIAEEERFSLALFGSKTEPDDVWKDLCKDCAEKVKKILKE